MKEIGGYIEFEHFHSKMLHEKGVKLDCGRSCLSYLIEARKITKIAVPSFMCSVMFKACDQYGVQMIPYAVGYDLRPNGFHPDGDAYFLIANYYGQLTAGEIAEYKSKYERVIIDNTQAYFAGPVDGVDTLYSCRKYFGVPDGGILYTDAALSRELPQSESYDQMLYLLGRFERNASEFYGLSSMNNRRFDGQMPMRMSKLTENLLHGIDYEYIRKRREENYAYLDRCFRQFNRLQLRKPEGPFAYPLLVHGNASSIRKQMIDEKIYIPTLWPNVVDDTDLNTVDHDLAMNILPLPCDQRYGLEEMEYMARRIASLL